MAPTIGVENAENPIVGGDRYAHHRADTLLDDALTFAVAGVSTGIAAERGHSLFEHISHHRTAHRDLALGMRGFSRASRNDLQLVAVLFGSQEQSCAIRVDRLEYRFDHPVENAVQAAGARQHTGDLVSGSQIALSALKNFDVARLAIAREIR